MILSLMSYFSGTHSIDRGVTYIDMLKKDASLSCVDEIRAVMLDRKVWRGVVAALTKKPTEVKPFIDRLLLF